MLEDFTFKRVPCGDADIQCCVGGSGPPLLLLHGFPQNLFEWARVAPVLAEHFTVVCADLRGYGASGKPMATADLQNYSFRSMAADQVELMRVLGFSRFHLVGHDRGARTAYRLALDQEEAVLSLALLDIVPTLSMFGEVNSDIARVYWHWFFLQQAAPFPEKMVEADPDHFYEAFFFGLGKMALEDFGADQLQAYREAWRHTDFIRSSCADYRAAAQVDCLLDQQDVGRKVECPALVCWGADGVMPRLFDVRGLWTERLADITCATVPGGHFFVDQYPQETAQVLRRFLLEAASHAHTR